MISEIQIFDDPDGVAQAAAATFVERAAATIAAEGEFAVALSGGSTPRRTFQILAAEPYRGRLDWERVHFFWGDERTVPPDHPDSNYGAAYASLLSRLAIPAGNLHRVRAELSPAQAAARYEAEIRGYFRLSADELPRFDLALLGMGADGHTASLFPQSEALNERRRIAVAPYVAKLRAYRVTLTYPVFNSAACIVFLVTGADKAETLRQVLGAEDESIRYPAQLIRPANGELRWLVDRAAGRRLGGASARPRPAESPVDESIETQEGG